MNIIRNATGLMLLAAVLATPMLAAPPARAFSSFVAPGQGGPPPEVKQPTTDGDGLPNDPVSLKALVRSLERRQGEARDAGKGRYIGKLNGKKVYENDVRGLDDASPAPAPGGSSGRGSRPDVPVVAPGAGQVGGGQ
jgi:hypothetical protein